MNGANEPRYHVCLSGSLACSGLSPCPPCHAFQQNHILTHGQIAAGMNGAILAFVHDLMSALAQQGVQVELPPIFRTAEDQDRAFVTGCTEGWRRFHNALSDESFRAQHGVHLTDIAQLMEKASERMAEQATAAAPQAPPEAEPPPPKPVDEAKIRAEQERARELSRPMDAEEIALAGMPAPEDHPPTNGAAS